MRVATDQTHAVVVQRDVHILNSSVPLLPLDSLVAGGESEGRGGERNRFIIGGKQVVQCVVCSVQCAVCNVQCVSDEMPFLLLEYVSYILP